MSYRRCQRCRAYVVKRQAEWVAPRQWVCLNTERCLRSQWVHIYISRLVQNGKKMSDITWKPEPHGPAPSWCYDRPEPVWSGDERLPDENFRRLVELDREHTRSPDEDR